MLEKTWYFKVGEKDVRISLPKDGFGRALTLIMAGIFVFDVMVGNVLGAILMGLFVCWNTVSIK